MTNYQSTTFYVEDSNSDSAAFTPLADNGEHALKMWRTAFLPDGQPVEVNVLFTDEDVRGLQAFLNDQFGRGRERFDVQHPNPEQIARDPEQMATRQEALDRLSDPANVAAVVGVQFPEGLPEPPPGAERVNAAYATTVSGQPTQIGPRQCPVIYNGVQCSKPDWHVNSQLGGTTAAHEFVQDWTTVQPNPQTGDGAVTPPADYPADLQPVYEERDGSVVPAATPSSTRLEHEYTDSTGVKWLHGGEQQFCTAPECGATGNSDPHPPAKKKSNRRKKEEKAYDDALATFRANPNSQLEYVALTNAAEALRKRFPNDSRLTTYDLHVQHQDIRWLTDPEYGIVSNDPAKNEKEQNAASSFAGQDVPHFAPEQPNTQPTPFIPPAEGPQSAEELQAAQAFPCQQMSADGTRQCTRPAGHELANPPKPHIYPPIQDGQTLPAIPNFIPPTLGPDHNAQGFNVEPFPGPNPGFTSTPVGQPAQDGSGFTQATIPPFQIPQPTQTVSSGAPALSFQIPPTPDGTDLQPPAPTAPPWGGQ